MLGGHCHPSPCSCFPSLGKLTKKCGVPSLFSCVQLCYPMDCSPPGPSVHGILQARTLEWVAMPSSRGSSQPRDQPMSLTSPALAGGFFTTSAIWEALLFIIRFLKITLFIWLRWVFVAARAFSSCSKQGLLSSCGVRASHCSGFSCCRAQIAGCLGFSSCRPQVLEHRLSSCRARA